MSSYEIKARELAVDLVNIGALKFGDFKMKVGLNSPIYFDLRVIISHPSLLIKLADLLIEVIGNNIPYKHLCGVPYTALPIATLISAKQNVPMLMRRKEAKAYGTKKLIEGQFTTGERCLIVEDVVTSGSSVLETVNDLRKEGLEVTDAVVVLDREQGGYENLRKNGIKIHSLFTLRSILNELAKTGTVPQADLSRSYKYLDDNSQIQVKLKSLDSCINRLNMSFEERSKQTKSPIAKKLLKIMTEKKTTLCVAADKVNSDDLFKLAESVAPYICILKTHIDIIKDFKPECLNRLKDLADKHNFLILEDRKFADIGNTVKLQYESGIYNISNWSDMVTAHALPGPGILKALKTSSDKGVFLLAEMSSEGTLTNSDYAKEAIKIAETDPELVIGIVCQSKDLIKSPGLIQLTPGVKLSSSNDSLGQQYNTPFKVVLERGADVAVVGRGISESEKPAEVAKMYRDALWEAYLKRIDSKND